MTSIKSTKKTMESKKLYRKRTNYLELVIRDTKGKYTKLSLPVKIVRVPVKPSNKKVNRLRIEPETVLKFSIKIDNMQPKDFIPKSLRRKTIHFTRKNQKMEGIIIHASISMKGSEGGSVPNPPPPVH